MWRVFTIVGEDVADDDAAAIEWPGPTFPAELPSYMTQGQPVITRDLPIVWGRDPNTVYVADEEGVWRVTLGEHFMPTWDLIHTEPHVKALAMSPSGGYLVVESGVEEVRDISELHLGADGVEARLVGTGWGVAFGPLDDTYHYADYWAFYRVLVGEEASSIKGITAMPAGS